MLYLSIYIYIYLITSKLFRYIHRVCIEKNFSDVYGILEPAMLNIVLNETITLIRAKKYIQERLRDVPKLYHLLPYLHG
jgi:hypothetical protein